MRYSSIYNKLGRRKRMKPNLYEKKMLEAIIRTAQMLLNGEAETEEDFVDALESINIPLNGMLEEKHK